MLQSSTDQILTGLNAPQYEAVTYGDGPLLIFAGAGSGKTRVLTHRIAHLLLERHVAPDSVIAVTFTNKAANEMKERIGRLVGRGVNRMWVGTFHSICARILRLDGEAIGVPSNYLVFDTDDQTTVINDCCKEFEVDTSRLKPNTILHKISSAKNELITPSRFADEADTQDKKMIARIYERYQQKLGENNGLDFDDLIMKTVELFRERDDILLSYQSRFHYQFVDEYQDINTAQYQFIKALAAGTRNLCVVGDDDQSIYTWRGADSRLLLQFEKDYPEAHVIKLEQNYRSPQLILDAAYHVIAQNVNRKEKRLWTEREGGARIRCYRANDEHAEGAFIARVIRDLAQHEKKHYRDFAVLYRINAQSRVIEQMMISQGIPYRIVGGLKFFARKEIKDVVSYLRVLYNPDDSISLRRIINCPPRDIGAKTVSKLEEFATQRGMGLMDMVMAVEHTDLPARAQTAVKKFALLMSRLMQLSGEVGITELTRSVIEDTGYEQALEEENSIQSRTRLENVRELLSATQEIEAQAEDDDSKSLHAFLEHISLQTELDSAKEEDDCVTLMTLHAAKGLEFPIVFLTGLEEKVFPLERALMSKTAMEEERRLCYVGITRTMEQLYCTMAGSRTIFGVTIHNEPSRFIKDIPDECLEGIKGGWSLNPAREWSWDDVDTKKSPAAEAILAATGARAEGSFRAGDRVKHQVFGEGMVLAIQGSGQQMKVTVHFTRIGTKTLALAYAPLTKL